MELGVNGLDEGRADGGQAKHAGSTVHARVVEEGRWICRIRRAKLQELLCTRIKIWAFGRMQPTRGRADFKDKCVAAVMSLGGGVRWHARRGRQACRAWATWFIVTLLAATRLAKSDTGAPNSAWNASGVIMPTRSLMAFFSEIERCSGEWRSCIKMVSRPGKPNE